jgi:mannose-6-phosphate isomerase
VTETTRASLRAHLCDELLPLWERHGLDRTRGGYWSRLGPDLRPLPDGHKRLLVHARQIYAFSRVTELGAGSWARDAAAHGHAFLVERFRDTRHGGWFTTTDDAGAPLDRRKDLYGHAFVIFALAHHFRVYGAPESLRLARETLAIVQDRLRDPLAGGFFEGASEDWKPLAGARRQNPHMHGVEALLALDAAAPDGDALAEARRLVDLLQTRWIDAETGALREHFDPAWRALPGDAGRIVEPGHHFEWSGLLDRLEARVPGADVRALGTRLFDFARRHGVDADGGVFDQLDPTGRPTVVTKRLWPQTERVKALASRLRATTSAELRGELEAGLRYCFARYVDPVTRGWHEHLARDGRVISEAQNATSVYHVVTALAEASEALEG